MIESFAFGWTLFFIIGIISIKLLSGSYSITKQQTYLYVVIFCLTFFLLGSFGNAITPDYPSYKEIIILIGSTKNPNVHIENFWIYFIHLLGNNYLIYRICLFFCIFSGFGYIIYKLKDSNIIIFISIYALVLLFPHLGLRATLFLIIFTIGIIELAEKKWIISIILFIISFFIHKVSYIAIPILILTLIIPINNNKIIISTILLFIAIAIILRTLIFSNLSYLIEYMWQNGITGSSYLEREDNISERGNIIWRLIDYFSTTSIYILKILILILLYQYHRSFNRVNQFFYRTLLWSTIMSLSILLIGLPDRTISYRCATIGDIPMCYLWALLPYMDKSQYNKYKKYMILFTIIIFFMQNIFIRGLMNRL